MREIRTSGSVGAAGGNSRGHPTNPLQPVVGRTRLCVGLGTWGFIQDGLSLGLRNALGMDVSMGSLSEEGQGDAVERVIEVAA